MLAPKKYPGLLVTPADKEQALYKGLLGLGAQLSQGYTDKPTSFMGNLGQAGLGFQKGYGDQIALTKADQLQNMQAQSAQASLEAQKMKIAEAARLKKLQEDQEQAAMRYLGSQRQYSPNMMDASGIEQTMDTRNATGAMQLNPLEQIQIDSGQGYKVLEGQQAREAAAAVRKAELEDKIAFDAVKRFRPPPVTNINMQPQISKDYRKITDSEGKITGAEPIPGGKADPITIAKIEKAKNQEKEAARLKKELPGVRRNLLVKHQRLPILKDNVADIKKLSEGFFTSGLSGQLLGPLASSDQYELESKMKNIQSAFGLEELVRIKEAGGTFGALSDSEMTLLISSVQALDPNLGPEALGKSLDDAMALYERGLETAKQDFVELYPDSRTPWNVEPVRIKGDKDPNYTNLRKGDYYIGPDNVTRMKQ